MITITYQAKLDGKSSNFRFFGLKDDEKPTVSYKGEPIANGSLFVEAETGITYDYDGAGAAWIKRANSGGGGGDIDGDGVPDTIAGNDEIDSMINDIFN